MTQKMSRRQFLKVLAGATGGAGLIFTGLMGKSLQRAIAQAFGSNTYLPLISRGSTFPGDPSGTSTITPTSTDNPQSNPTASPTPYTTPGVSPRVVHVHDTDATIWTGSTDYWNYVDQNVTNTMVDQGMLALTGASSVANAWRSLLPNYQTGQGIAIKVNFNNAQSCSDSDGAIDAIIEPVNAIVRGLKQIGVAESDIWVFDATRSVPNRFVDGCAYNSVQFFGGCRISTGFAGTAPNSIVTFSPPSGVPLPSEQIKITDLLVNTSYLINLPILKNHGMTGTTLAFKNHLGSINRPDLLHQYLHMGSYYQQGYSPLVDVYKNPHIAEKTILTIGDGLFGCSISNIHPPQTWSTFNNDVPNSLFFAIDPVAADCVMTDILYAEVTDSDPNYLAAAGAAGLGVFERGDPWGAGYNQIDYVRINL